MLPDEFTQAQPNDTIPSTPVERSRAVITAERNLPVLDGEHRQLALADAPVAPPSITLQQASNIAYSAVSGIILLIVAAAIVTAIVWFVGDLHAVGSTPIPASVTDHNSYTRNEIINAAVGFLANLVLVLVLVEVFSAIVNFVRTRRATARPLILVPLYIVMRAIMLLGAQLLLNTTSTNAAAYTDTTMFIEVLAEMGVFSLVGLSLSIALAALREPAPKGEPTKK